jgi:nicotinate-nucleotide pyrophosphorylase (carboxylating)
MTEKSVAESLDSSQVEALIRLAIKEDIGTGDLTSSSVLSRRAKARGTFMVKEDGLIAGLPLLAVVYRNINKNVKVTPLLEDGRMVLGGTPVAHVTGPAIAILSGERIALNFLQRLSGIATLAARFVEEVRGTNVEILDTRKTMPGWRCLEKYAVRAGGGRNHRMGLFDHVLIKDNHLRLSAYQPIADAVGRARQKCRPGTVVEVEAESLAQVEEALAAGADIIMLDNMAPELMTKAVKIIRAAAVVPRIEASGGITLKNARKVALTGVDWISVGELTHSAPALDIGLDLDPL